VLASSLTHYTPLHYVLLPYCRDCSMKQSGSWNRSVRLRWIMLRFDDVSQRSSRGSSYVILISLFSLPPRQDFIFLVFSFLVTQHLFFKGSLRWYLIHQRREKRVISSNFKRIYIYKEEEKTILSAVWLLLSSVSSSLSKFSIGNSITFSLFVL